MNVDGRSDAYSLTVVFYELITGRKPYTGDTPVNVLLNQINEPIPDPRIFVSDITESVNRFLNRAMAKEPENRYTDMKEYLLDFEGLQLQSLSQAACGNSRIKTITGLDFEPSRSIRTAKTNYGKLHETDVSTILFSERKSGKDLQQLKQKKRTVIFLLTVIIVSGLLGLIFSVQKQELLKEAKLQETINSINYGIHGKSSAGINFICICFYFSGRNKSFC